MAGIQRFPSGYLTGSAYKLGRSGGWPVLADMRTGARDPFRSSDLFESSRSVWRKSQVHWDLVLLASKLFGGKRKHRTILGMKSIRLLERIKPLKEVSLDRFKRGRRQTFQ